jgi:hypothetical protein
MPSGCRTNLPLTRRGPDIRGALFRRSRNVGRPVFRRPEIVSGRVQRTRAARGGRAARGPRHEGRGPAGRGPAGTYLTVPNAPVSRARHEDGRRERQSRRARGETQCACARGAVGHARRSCVLCMSHMPQFPAGAPPPPPSAAAYPLRQSRQLSCKTSGKETVFGFGRKSAQACPVTGRT